MRKMSLSALVAAGLVAGGLSAPGASAADLGGNCCADLEERVAELEATTARKGNRKVSLTISGWVAKQLAYFDDGVESNFHITDTGSVSIGTHVRFSGQAQISPGWTAGFVINLETIDNDSLLVNQNTNSNVGNAFIGGGANQVGVESAYWFVKSDNLGRISLGKQSSAADNQAILVDGSGSLVVANYVQYDNNAFFLRTTGAAGGILLNGVGPAAGVAAVRWGNLANCHTVNAAGGVSSDCDGFPNNNIRYDTPTFGGFSASASWGEDDIWALSGRYAGEHSGFKLAAAIAYVHSSDEANFSSNGANAARANGGLDVGHFQAGLYIQHVPTGLFVYSAYGKEDLDTTGSARGAGQLNPEGDNWYLKAGLRQKWNPLGATVLYGEYGENEDKFPAELFDAFIPALGIFVTNTEMRQYGIGVVQEIDAAAMSVWLGWRHYEVESFTISDGAASTDISGILEDLDIVKAGALINF